jgi:hypothetical protein
MTTLPVVQPTPYDQDTLDDVDAVLRDGALNGHLPGVQALRRALECQRALLGLGQQFSFLVPPTQGPPAPPTRPSIPGGATARRSSIPPPEERCGHHNPERGPCLKRPHPRAPRLHGYAQEVTSGRIPAQRQGPPAYFDAAS